MRPMKERVQVKLNSMASILMDNILIPGEPRQRGSDEMKANLYDKDGNKFAFKLSLNVIPDGELDPEDPDVATPEERLNKIESDIATIQDEIDELKANQNSIEDGL